jgi:hypothetical protein
MTMTLLITVLLRWFSPCRRAGTRIGDKRPRIERAIGPLYRYASAPGRWSALT